MAHPAVLPRAGAPGGRRLSDIVLYFSPFSRAFTARWMLEEIGVPYRIETTDIRAGAQKSEAYRRINPMGKVPALTDGDVVVSENPAICLYLADRYSLGTLAPRIEDPRRGAYCKWMVFSTAVVEPSLWLDEPQDPASAMGRGWGDRASVIATLDKALSAGPWLLGDDFSACDVAVGAVLAVATFNKKIAEPPASFAAYIERLDARPAYQRAAQATWGVG